MSRCLTRISLALVLLLSSEVWAIGLGDINLDSALNEPLRAEIELLSATPEELANLTVSLASAETFARYGIDRPFFLQEIEFNVQPTGPSGAVVQIRSRSPITEPFVTFLVEATWSSGRLADLRTTCSPAGSCCRGAQARTDNRYGSNRAAATCAATGTTRRAATGPAARNAADRGA
jgi:pilus assembly protein FimV